MENSVGISELPPPKIETKMKTITIFSWGYYGWGSATKQLIKAVDAVEQRRGFEPPIFVDIRISRAVRAIGFNGSAFEHLLGDRHIWMPTLGNKRILSRTGKRIQIAQPEAANELLDSALAADKEKRRVIFFCSCMWPKFKGKTACHREVVTDLLFAAAKKRKMSLRVVEWPGDERRRKRIELNAEHFKAVLKGARFVPIPRSVQPDVLNGPAWGSIFTFACGKEAVHRLVGPLIWRKNRWQLQILNFFLDSEAPLSDYAKLAMDDVSNLGLEARCSK